MEENPMADYEAAFVNMCTSMETEEDPISEYESSLNDLKRNNKPLINALTILAEEYINCSVQIVELIENHLSRVNTGRKLSTLYLIDSLLKNVGQDYLTLFNGRIVSIFSSVFEEADEKMRFYLYHLRRTWTKVLPDVTLYEIDTAIRTIDPEWPLSIGS